MNNGNDDSRHHDTAFIDSTVRKKNTAFLTDMKSHEKTVDKILGIEPATGCLKSDCRLCNFYKGVTGDAVNMLPAVVAYNFKRTMKTLLDLIKKSAEYGLLTMSR